LSVNQIIYYQVLQRSLLLTTELCVTSVCRLAEFDNSWLLT